MSVKLYFHPEADRELTELSREKQKVVREEVEKFKEEGIKYEKFGRVTNQEVGFECYRLKVKQEKPVKVNQRIILDIYQRKFVAYGVRHRDEVYSQSI